MAIENEFTDRETELIHDAIGHWIEASDSEDAVIFTKHGFVDEGLFTIEDWEKDRDYGVMFKCEPGEPGYLSLIEDTDKTGFAGVAREDSGNIVIAINAADNEDYFFRVVLHELGHIHGLHHFDGGIMKAIGGQHSCITLVDLEVYCDLNHCGPNAHSTCE